MILSVHVAKAAGNSFRELLLAEYGDRIMLDYGDWAGFDTPEARERRTARTAAMRARGAELQGRYDIIHGHFQADKYLGLFPQSEYVALFRDPYQQSVAHYYFLLRNPQRDHPEERIFHEAKMELQDYLEWSAFYNHQSQYLGSVTVDDLAMAGVSEQFDRSVALFNALFKSHLRGVRFENVNPEREGSEYEISVDVRKAVDKYRAADVELYRRAKEKFEKMADRAGV